MTTAKRDHRQQHERHDQHEHDQQHGHDEQHEHDKRREYDYAREFGRRVRALRLQLGVSQEALGERARLHRTYVGRLERGELNPSLHNVVRLATALGVDVTDLVRALRLEDSGP